MKKIMFNDKFMLTKAVLDGRKTQTRRICKEQVWAHSDIVNAENGIFHFEIPKYNVGEVVAVAQSYKDVDSLYSAAFNRKHSVHGMTIDMLDCIPSWEIERWRRIREQFVATRSWNNKMFVKGELMPHLIRITDVRVECLQDISEKDAISEGIIYAGLTYEDYGEPMFIIEGCKQTFGSARDAYAWLIDKISGKGTWQSNPYVFVYDFELVK